MYVEPTTYRGRRAMRLSSGAVELTTLTSGGYVAEIRFADSPINPLWQPNWDTIDPEDYDPERHPEYGEIEGKALASIVGHSVCLNHFGELSEAEMAAQGYQHGEANCRAWETLDRRVSSGRVGLTYGVDLPEAGMRLVRAISMRRGESIVRFDEDVTNLRGATAPWPISSTWRSARPSSRKASRVSTFRRPAGTPSRGRSGRSTRWSPTESSAGLTPPGRDRWTCSQPAQGPALSAPSRRSLATARGS